MKNLKPVPKLDTEDEVDHFWSINDSVEYLDWPKAEFASFSRLKRSSKTIPIRNPESVSRKQK
ncbi:MAG TPA: CopG family antitoxin [bacterium]